MRKALKWTEQFSWDKTAKGFEKWLEEILDEESF